MSKSDFDKAPYDRENSTYRQKIRFLNGKIIDGYSKKMGFVEPIDPNNCLTNFILRMYLLGYLRICDRIDPVDYIEYRWNHNQELIMTCYYEYPEFNPEILRNNMVLVKWTNDFYKDIARNKPLSYMEKKYHRRGREAKTNELDVNQIAFSSMDHVVSKIKYLLNTGKYSIDEIIYFYRKVIEVQFKREKPQVVSQYNMHVNDMVAKFTRK